MGEPPSIGLADSALATPHAGFGDYEAYPSLIEKAAVLVERLARNHPLPDGNKRAAFLSLDRFLAANGARADVMLGSQNYSVSGIGRADSGFNRRRWRLRLAPYLVGTMVDEVAIEEAGKVLSAAAGRGLGSSSSVPTPRGARDREAISTSS